MKGLKEYQAVNNQSKVLEADSHQLIGLLYDKVLESIAAAKLQIEAERYDAKSSLINKAIEVIGGLREFLDFEKGGEIAARYEQLYDWAEQTLFTATQKNSVEMLSQVETVIRELQEGWNGIRVDYEKAASSAQAESNGSTESQVG